VLVEGAEKLRSVGCAIRHLRPTLAPPVSESSIVRGVNCRGGVRRSEPAASAMSDDRPRRSYAALDDSCLRSIPNRSNSPAHSCGSGWADAGVGFGARRLPADSWNHAPIIQRRSGETPLRGLEGIAAVAPAAKRDRARSGALGSPPQPRVDSELWQLGCVRLAPNTRARGRDAVRGGVHSTLVHRSRATSLRSPRRGGRSDKHSLETQIRRADDLVNHPP